MRVHITLDDDLVAELDRRAGARGRSGFIAAAIRRLLTDEQHWEDIESGFASIPDEGHDWDADPAAWVRAQRYGDTGRVG
jgi:Arc/MetJ family transcription regulator